MKNPRLFKIDTLIWKLKQTSARIPEITNPKIYLKEVEFILKLEKEIEIQAAYVQLEGEIL